MTKRPGAASRLRIKALGLNISLWLVLMLPLAYAAGFLEEYLIAYMSATLHELGHAAAARVLGLNLREMRLMPAGLSLTVDESSSGKKSRLLLYSAGPASNLLLAGAAAGLFGSLPSKGWLGFFILANLSLAVFNLIPALPLDGGRIIQVVLSERLGIRAAARLLRRLGIALAALLLALGILQLIFGRRNFTLFIIGFYLLLLVGAGGTEAAFMNIKQIVFRRSRLLKKGVYPTRDLVALKSVKIGDILKDLDFDRFHFIHVLDDDLKVIGHFSEIEIMDSLIKYNADTTFGQLLQL